MPKRSHYRFVHFQSKHGFTLIELVVVMLIISIMAAGAALSLDFGTRQTRLKTSAKALYKSFRYAQEEAILSGKTLAVNISEDYDFDSDKFEQSVFYKFTWLELYTQGQNDFFFAQNDTQEQQQLTPSLNLDEEPPTLRSRRYILFGTALLQHQKDKLEQDNAAQDNAEQALDSLSDDQQQELSAPSDSSLETIELPVDLNFEFYQDGSLLDVSLFEIDERNTLTLENEQQEQQEQQSNEDKEYTPHIRFYPDGEVDPFAIHLIDAKDNDQGYIIESVNGSSIKLRSIGAKDA